MTAAIKKPLDQRQQGPRRRRFRRERQVEVVPATIEPRSVDLLHAAQHRRRTAAGRAGLRTHAVGHRRPGQSPIRRRAEALSVETMQAAHDVADHVQSVPKLLIDVLEHTLAHLEQRYRPAIHTRVIIAPLGRG